MASMQRVGKTATMLVGLGKRKGSIAVQYHDTRVVEIRPKSVKLQSGGWRTRTTKVRMNQASNEYGLGYTVFQKKGSWFVASHGKIKKFKDGMKLRR